MTAQIDKGVPLAPDGRGRHGHGNAKWPWKDMDVGDSFFMAGRKLNNAGAQANKAGNALNYKFACRTVEGGVRVWRIA